MKSNHPLNELLSKTLDALLDKETHWYARLIALLPFSLLLGAYLIVFLMNRPEICSSVIGATVIIFSAPSLPVILGLMAIGSLLTIVIYRSCDK